MPPAPKPVHPSSFILPPSDEATAILDHIGQADPAICDLAAIAEAAVDLRDTAALYGLDLASPLVNAAWRDLVATVTAIYGPLTLHAPRPTPHEALST